MDAIYCVARAITCRKKWPLASCWWASMLMASTNQGSLESTSVPESARGSHSGAAVRGSACGWPLVGSLLRWPSSSTGGGGEVRGALGSRVAGALGGALVLRGGE